MTKPPYIWLIGVAMCAAALVLPGCGGSGNGKELPKVSVAALRNQLDVIERRVKAGACRDVIDGNDPDTTVVQSEINSLPSNVDKDVRDALKSSFDKLFQLVREECAPARTETTPTETTPTVTETAPTVTQTVPTQTTTTPTTTTPKPKRNKPKKQSGNTDGDGEGVSGGGGTPAEGGG